MGEPDIDLPRPSRLPPSEEGRLPAGVLRVPARAMYLGLIGMAVNWYGGRAGLGQDACRRLETAVDEACTNVILYAFPTGAVGAIEVVFSHEDSGLSITIQDNGTPFDPRDGIRIAKHKRELDPASGGMGLMLIQQLADKIKYEWDEHKGNQLTLFKHR